MTPLLKSLAYIIYALLTFQLSRMILCALHIKKFIISAFINGVRFDMNVIATLWSIPLLLVNLPLKRYYRTIFIISSTIMYLTFLLMVFMLGVDIAYFGYAQKHVSTEIISIKEDIGSMFQIAVNQYIHYIIIFVVFSLISLYFWIKIERAKTNFISPLKQTMYLILLSAIIIVSMRGTLSSKPIHIIDAFSRGRDYGNISLNGAFTIYRTFYSVWNSGVYEKEIKTDFFSLDEAKKILGLKGEFPFERESEYCAGGKDKNLVVIILESWTPEYIDGISKKGYGVTENFDRILKNGTYIPNFYSAGIRSIHGIQAIMTGVPVIPSFPSLGFGLEGIRFLGIGEILKKNGYKTIFIQSSKRRSYRLDSLAKASGFDEAYGMEDIEREVGRILDYKSPPPPFGWDYETLMFALKKMKEVGEKFAVFIFTGSTHPTYPYLPQFSKYKYSPQGLGGYLDALHYSDWSIGEFMRKAEKEKWFQNTFFIFVADHPAHQKEEDFREKFHIPFVIYPKILSDVIDVVGSQYDILPTILDILCIKTKFYSIGKSIFRKSKDDFVFVTEGDIVGAISEKGYLAHNTMKVILSEGDTDELERKLLALIQMSVWAIKKNRWAR